MLDSYVADLPNNLAGARACRIANDFLQAKCLLLGNRNHGIHAGRPLPMTRFAAAVRPGPAQQANYSYLYYVVSTARQLTLRATSVIDSVSSITVSASPRHFAPIPAVYAAYAFDSIVRYVGAMLRSTWPHPVGSSVCLFDRCAHNCTADAQYSYLVQGIFPSRRRWPMTHDKAHVSRSSRNTPFHTQHTIRARRRLPARRVLLVSFAKCHRRPPLRDEGSCLTYVLQTNTHHG